MKLKIFSMLVILGVLSVTPMIYMGKFDPLAFLETGIKAGTTEVSRLQARAPKNLSSVVTDKKVHVYKWRDEYGVMQFSNTPPPDVSNAEQLVLNPGSNLIHAVKTPEKEETGQAVQAETPNPYSIKGMKKLMDDARGIEQLLQQHHEDQQKVLHRL